jgi:hypothetical protein
VSKLTDMIDARAASFSRESEKAALKLVRLVAGLMEQGASKAAIVEQLADPTVLKRLKLESGWSGAVDGVLGSFGRDVLGNLSAAGAVSTGSLQGLVVTSQRSFLAASDKYFADVMAELTRNVLAGRPANLIREAIQQTMRADRVEALVNTTLNTYSRSVRAVLAENEPAETLYVYSGPADDRTRDECLEMMAAGELTKDEIEDRFGNAFIDGGGYNCRHQWIRKSEATEVDPEGAKEARRKRALIDG